jgi:hypothetical protein
LREDTLELRASVETHGAQLDKIFERVEEVANDRRDLRAEMDELKGELHVVATGKWAQLHGSTCAPVKSEPAPLNDDIPEFSPGPALALTSGVESFYATEREDGQEACTTQNQRPSIADRRDIFGETPGDVWTRTSVEPRSYGCETDEEIDQWLAVSEASGEQHKRGRGGAHTNPRGRGWKFVGLGSGSR